MFLARATLLSAALLAAAVAHSAPVHHYTVSIDHKLQTLKVRACFDGAPPRSLVAASEHAPFFVKTASGEEDPKRLALNGVPDDGCIDYRVDVAGIAILGQLTLGSWIGNDLIVAPDVWLWRPANIDADIELHFDLPAGIAVSAPWWPLPDGGYDVGHTPAHWPASVAFGHFEERQIEVPGAVLRLAVLDGVPPADVDAMQTWVADAGRAVAGLYGRFPVDHAQALVIPQGEGEDDSPVPYAHVQRGGAGAVRFFIDQQRTLKSFFADWIATHEFAHLTLPLLERGGHWLAEGVATYYQNVLGARSGHRSPQEAWEELHEGFERGKRASGDATLLEASANIYRDETYTRVYWSGAAVAMLADLQLRKVSDGKESLDSALGKLGRCCQPWDRAWSARELLARLDELTGTTIFTALYREHVFSKDFPDVTDAYTELGLQVRAGGIQLRHANARVRDAIMRDVHSTR